MKRTLLFIWAILLSAGTVNTEIENIKLLLAVKPDTQAGRISVVDKNNLNAYVIDSVKSALHFLSKGRADVYVGSPLIVLDKLKTDEFKNKGIVLHKPPLSVIHLFTYFDKRYSTLAIKYEAALKALKGDGIIIRILKKTK